MQSQQSPQSQQNDYWMQYQQKKKMQNQQSDQGQKSPAMQKQKPDQHHQNPRMQNQKSAQNKQEDYWMKYQQNRKVHDQQPIQHQQSPIIRQSDQCQKSPSMQSQQSDQCQKSPPMQSQQSDQYQKSPSMQSQESPTIQYQQLTPYQNQHVVYSQLPTRKRDIYCCCCIPRKPGFIMMAILGIIWSLADIGLLVAILTKSPELDLEHYNIYHSFEVNFVLGIVIFVRVLFITGCVFLLIGVFEHRKSCFWLYVLFAAINTIVNACFITWIGTKSAIMALYRSFLILYCTELALSALSFGFTIYFIFMIIKARIRFKV